MESIKGTNRFSVRRSNNSWESNQLLDRAKCRVLAIASLIKLLINNLSLGIVLLILLEKINKK
jgi:hypothetical protein